MSKLREIGSAIKNEQFTPKKYVSPIIFKIDGKYYRSPDRVEQIQEDEITEDNTVIEFGNTSSKKG